jgi:replication factor C subunit 1
VKKIKDIKKKRRIVDSDDEEIESVGKNVNTNKMTSSSNKVSSPQDERDSKKKKKTLDSKEDILSVFGGPIKRTERTKPNLSSLSSSATSKAVKIEKNDNNLDVDINIVKKLEKLETKDSPGKENCKTNEPSKIAKDKAKDVDVQKDELVVEVVPIKASRSEEKNIENLKTPFKSRSQPTQSVANKNEKLSPKKVSSNLNVSIIKKPATIVHVEPEYSFVDKYKPTSIKQIIGQQGPQSNANKLQNWLLNWYKNHGDPSKKKKPNPYGKDPDGSSFKCALLSGPPGN